MEHADIEARLGGEMPHTGDKRLPERPVIGPCGKDLVDGRLVNGRVPLDVLRNGSTLPWQPGIEDPQEQVQDAMIAQCARWPTRGHREVREDTCGALGVGELDGDRRRCRLCCRYAHHARALYEAYCHVLGNQIASYPTRGW